MKKYINPELEILALFSIDVMSASNPVDDGVFEDTNSDIDW